MILDRSSMLQVEKDSGKSVQTLMNEVSQALAEQIMQESNPQDSILFLCGKGNNGGDGLTVAGLLTDRNVFVYLVDGQPNGKESLRAMKKLPKTVFLTSRSVLKQLSHCQLVIDAVYGFSFHGPLERDIKKLFQKVNDSGVRVLSIDINSGCEADTGTCDLDALHSDLTYALGARKPFHAMRKNHQRFQSCCVIPLDLPYPTASRYVEMNEERFFQNFPVKSETTYKGSFGKACIIGGCWGMAGALAYNIIGAKTLGTSYLQVALPQEIYELIASRFFSPVYHPFGHDAWVDPIRDVIENSSSLGFGSGAVYMDHKEQILDLILQEAHCPIVLDAEALRMLKQNTYVLRFVKAPVIVTPHLSEFADLVNKTREEVLDHRIQLALTFAKDYGVIVVLKSPNTLVVSPSGDIYINESGNQALAQAGSGDVLTGMITAMLSFTRDVYQAVVMAVWLHGYLSDLGTLAHSRQNFSLEQYPTLMDDLFYSHGL